MEKYIIWILLAVCVGMHLWMMRKGHGHHDHDEHDDKKDDHDENKNIS
jgi:hypothetical protein